MKFLITADWHISTTRGLPREVLEKRYRDLVAEIYKKYIENGCTALWILGDTFDKSKPNIFEIELFLWVVDFFEQKQVNTIITTGNHESITRSHSFIDPFARLNSSLQYVEILPYAATRTWYTEDLGEYTVCFLPYTHIKNQYGIKEFSGDVLCSHARGTIEQFFVREEYPFERFEQSEFRKVFLGDIHLGHRYSEKIYYPGAPLDIKFGGKVTDTVIVFDAAEDSVEYVKIPSIPLEVERVDVKDIDSFLATKDLSKAHTKIVVTGDRERIQSCKEEVQEKVSNLDIPGDINISLKFSPDPIKYDMETRFNFTRNISEEVDRIEPLSVEELEMYLEYVGYEKDVADLVMKEFMEISNVL